MEYIIFYHTLAETPNEYIWNREHLKMFSTMLTNFIAFVLFNLRIYIMYNFDAHSVFSLTHLAFSFLYSFHCFSAFLIVLLKVYNNYSNQIPSHISHGFKVPYHLLFNGAGVIFYLFKIDFWGSSKL